MNALLPAAEYGTSGLADWIQSNVFVILILILAASVFWAVKSGSIAKGVTIAAGLLIGLFVLGIAVTPDASEDIGKFLVSLFQGEA